MNHVSQSQQAKTIMSDIRNETMGDIEFIREIHRAAFASHPHSLNSEQDIVDGLRAADALSVSLVAIDNEVVVGHIACSPIMIDVASSNWYGLGPVAVHPDLQGKGIGGALVRASIDQLRTSGASGVVLLGEPDYYRRFGFTARSELKLPGAPASHFLCLPLSAHIPSGIVNYRAAFG